ncbi:sigma 54-interacting transcriptional regulator [Wukongibacter baidiensis]|uniref:sigma 54-interacting transcriptional regulator n=1 Tax=Wukongibacter baidiensis TaxID=1723361 RepID=UPI003D7F4EC7
MKKIAVISMGSETSKNICTQIRELIGDKAEIKGYTLKDDISKEFKDCLVLITSYLVEKMALTKLQPGTKYIVARRVINYQHLRDVISIPAGTDVLLVNDNKNTCYTAIKQLKKLGINHINYHPYYPGIGEYKRLELAVTVGEPHLVPRCAKKIIDIGTRQIDITTLVEILNKLDLMEEKGDIISSQFVRDIVNISKQYNSIAEQSLELKNMFQTIIENSSDGIVYMDIDGKISVANEVLVSILRRTRDEIVGRNIENILPELKGWKVDGVENDIVKLFGKEVVAIKAPVKRKSRTIGYMVTIEDVNKIKKIEHELRRKNRKSEHNATYKFDDIICRSDSMRKTIALAQKLALSNSTILIQGESGTGKEFFAQAIHGFSKRKNGPFVPVNFAALSLSLLESELFGYEEGAFTGAKKGGKSGLFEEAHGGTIFLDEIGDAPIEFQARLLRVLQEKQVRRVGGTKLIPIDVRVITATNRDLKEEVEKGNFRQDLFYRLNVLPLEIPNLRERKEDIPLLLEHYLNRFANGGIRNINNFFSVEVLDYLAGYRWPGNVRELVNVIEYLVNIKDDNSLINIKDLPSYVVDESHKSGYTPSMEAMDKNMMWLLGVIKDRDGIGRRGLAEFARINGVEMGEGKIRSLMKVMEDSGLIKIKRGVKGSIITEKGLQTLMNFKGI